MSGLYQARSFPSFWGLHDVTNGIGMTGPIDRSDGGSTAYVPAKSSGNEAASALARRLISFRRRREELLGGALFANPAWDILLDLLVAEDEGRAISVSGLCVAAAVPAATALRWIAALVETGQIIRRPHPHDQNVMLVSLVPEASTRLRMLLGEF